MPGAVKLNLKDNAEAEEAFNQLLTIEAEGSKAVSVQEMAKKPIAEIIVGSLQDPQFGPTIMFGIGGVLVEIMKDVSFRIAPITDYDADEMIHEIKGFKILDGYRCRFQVGFRCHQRFIETGRGLTYNHKKSPKWI